MSVELYQALGAEDAPRAFSNGGKDVTNHSKFGAYQLARCVVQGNGGAKLPFSRSAVSEFEGCDPYRPDDVDTFETAPSPASSDLNPLGNNVRGVSLTALSQ